MADGKPKIESLDEFESKQSKGGKARAAKLSKSMRSEIAAKAAGVRWDTPQASHEGPLTIGDMTLDTAVLEDGTRVISQGKLMEAMGMYYSGYLSTARSVEDGSADTPLYLAYKRLQPYVIKHFGSLQVPPLKYRTRGGSAAHGVRAEALPKVCEVWLDARNDGVLGPRMKLIADKADILLRGFARVGIIALIDEATGYQYERDRKALEEYLAEFLSEELRRWVRTFPKEYFREMCRLRNAVYRPDMKLPPYFGHLTNDIVYSRLAPGVLEKLREKNPRNTSGRRPAKHHQWLSEDVGNPQLLQHLGLVVGLMKVSTTWDDFIGLLDKAAPVYQDLGMFNKLQNVDD